ncbi:MAG: zinc metallopeptidase [Bacteroidales bacterium]|jgi:Zn-dependent membrane protease YugP|nr:zinc metallopeptidase [Bacteroidales bacterium]
MNIWIFFIGFMILSRIISSQLSSRFRKYSRIPLPGGMTGRDVAEKMLRDHNITGVKLGSVSGQLSDHYNPASRTVNLSHDVYYGNSVAAAAVAAHECGHAVQHATAYSWLTMRSKLVPAVSLSSKWVQWILLAGILTVQMFPALLIFGIALFSLTTLFTIITLPVEINASRRALAWLSNAGITAAGTHDKAEDALRWAAYTYVIAAIGSIGTLLYYIMILTGSRR